MITPRQKLYHRLPRWLRRGAEKRRRAEASSEFRAAVSELKPGDIVLDCGANMGEITAALSATGCSVHAFEPDPYTVAILKQRFADAPNVEIIEAAVSVREGEANLFRAPEFDADPKKSSLSSSLLSEKKNVSASNAISVKTVDFLNYVRSLPQAVTLVKMDIEGAELDILEALAREPDHLGIKYLFVELHERKLPKFLDRFIAIRNHFATATGIHANLDWR